MTRTDNDVLTIGNAIVDILSQIEDDFLVRENLVKGSMRLIDQAEADRLFDHMGPTQMISGGCARGARLYVQRCRCSKNSQDVQAAVIRLHHSSTSRMTASCSGSLNISW